MIILICRIIISIWIIIILFLLARKITLSFLQYVELNLFISLIITGVKYLIKKVPENIIWFINEISKKEKE